MSQFVKQGVQVVALKITKELKMYWTATVGIVI